MLSFSVCDRLLPPYGAVARVTPWTSGPAPGGAPSQSTDWTCPSSRPPGPAQLDRSARV